MKKLILILAAVLTLMSCNKDEVVSPTTQQTLPNEILGTWRPSTNPRFPSNGCGEFTQDCYGVYDENFYTWTNIDISGDVYEYKYSYTKSGNHLFFHLISINGVAPDTSSFNPMFIDTDCYYGLIEYNGDIYMEYRIFFEQLNDTMYDYVVKQ